MTYRMLDLPDEELLASADLPSEGVVAVALRATGFDSAVDEVVELAVAGDSSDEGFHERVKPQNVDAWEPSPASGGIAPIDVEESPELYQFEEELSSIYEQASLIVALHGGFVDTMIERSWVTLPPHETFDLVKEFCRTHGTEARPTEPASVADLKGICAYYGLDYPDDDAGVLREAQGILACYQALRQELIEARDAKGQAHWDAYARRKEEELRGNLQWRQEQRAKQVKTLRINAILWLAAMVIFFNVAIQAYIRGVDGSIVVIAVAAGVFLGYKWIRSLLRISQIAKEAKEDRP